MGAGQGGKGIWREMKKLRKNLGGKLESISRLAA